MNSMVGARHAWRLAWALAPAACGGTLHFDHANALMVHDGMTRDEVAARLGPPPFVTLLPPNRDDAKEEWEYRNGSSRWDEPASDSLAVDFDDTRVVAIRRRRE